MAERDKKVQGAQPGGDGAETKAQWLVALEYTRENPTKVAGGAGFLLLCVVIGGLFSLKNTAHDKKVTTEYAKARQTEDPEARSEELKKIAGEGTRWSVEALYLQGEAAIEAKAYDKAREAFQQVLSQHGDSEYAPMAADGLAFIDENAGKLEDALKGYTHVFETWDDSFTGRRQPYNMGRVQEGLGNLAEAVTSYQKQVEIFPGSIVAGKSQAALDRLKASNPDLFPEDTPEVVSGDAAPTPEASAPEETPAETVTPATEAEATATEATPAAEDSATEAPAEATDATPADAASPVQDTDGAPAATGSADTGSNS